MHERGSGRGASRPVPATPVDALIARADDMAKGWLLELLAAAPLSAAPDVPAAELAADAPAVCAAVVEALASERGLDGALALAPDVARLGGARDSAAAVAAAEGLRRAVWGTLRDELDRGDEELLAPLADRLASVCAQLAEQTLRWGEGPVAEGPADAASWEDATPRDEPEPPLPRPATGEPDFGPLWMAALERQIAADERFALLLMELDGADRLRLAGPPETFADALERVGRAVRGCIRREDVLAHETDGRLWVIAPGAGRAGGSALARRIAEAVERAAELRGAPLTASLGVALFPDDARDPSALAGEAEEGLFAARAAGIRFSADPDEPAVGPRLVR